MELITDYNLAKERAQFLANKTGVKIHLVKNKYGYTTYFNTKDESEVFEPVKTKKIKKRTKKEKPEETNQESEIIQDIEDIPSDSVL